MAGEMSSSGRSDSGDSEDSLADTLGTPTGYHELEEENDGDAERLKFLASLTSSFGALEDVFTALLIAYRKEYGRLPTLDELGPLTDYALVLFLGMRTGLPREGTLGLFYLKSKYVDVKYATMQDRGLQHSLYLCLDDFQSKQQRLPTADELSRLVEQAFSMSVGVDAFTDDSDGLLEFWLLLETTSNA